jgi:protein-tyrosine phosphatase
MNNPTPEQLIESVQRPITKEDPFRICFVCLGNICRSPTAEGVFQHVIDKAGLAEYFEIDSSGTSAYHVGEPANSKSQQIANQNGVKLHSRSRQFKYSDLEYFDLLLAMDQSNLENIFQADKKDQYTDKIALMRTFDPEANSMEVPDPYYGGLRGFHDVFDIIKRSSEELLDRLKPFIED